MPSHLQIRWARSHRITIAVSRRQRHAFPATPPSYCSPYVTYATSCHCIALCICWEMDVFLHLQGVGFVAVKGALMPRVFDGWRFHHSSIDGLATVARKREGFLLEVFFHCINRKAWNLTGSVLHRIVSHWHSDPATFLRNFKPTAHTWCFGLVEMCSI